MNKSIKSNNNIKSSKNILNFDNINKTFYKNNTFFQYVLNNVRHKIELINDTNQSISILHVMNLINDELSDLRKNIEDYLIENSQFTSNNISKISNYEITPNNTFRFKTNNSNIQINETNNSGILGNLIKSNIYAKKNNGSKKIFFENFNISKKSKENSIFQNKEIIFSINQNETRGKTNFKNIKKINIPKNLKNNQNANTKNKISERGNNIENEGFLTSRYYYNTSPNKMQQKKNIFPKIKTEKKISHSFSEIFLKKNYKKASDFINEISETIEIKFLIKKRKEKNQKDQYTNTNDEIGYFPKNKRLNKKNRNHYGYKEQGINDIFKIKKEKEEDDDDYDFNKELYIITPKTSKEIFQVFSDNQEKKAKIKNKEMKNNYENIILDFQGIKQEESKLSLTPRKTEYIDKKLKTDPSSSLYDGQQSSENPEQNLIYFDKNKKRQIILENKDKEQKRNKKKKNKRKRNQDLTNIKSSKHSENNIFKKSINKNILNLNDENDDRNNKNNKRKDKKRKNKMKKIEAIINLINNNPNIKNKEELINKFINSDNFKDNELNEEEEESEEESIEEVEGEENEEEEEEEEEEEILEMNDIKPNNQSQLGKNKNLAEKKKKKKKGTKISMENLSENKDKKKNKKLKLTYKTNSKEKVKYSDNKKNVKEIIKRNNEVEVTSRNSINKKTKDNLIKKNKNEINEQSINSNKSKTVEKNKIIGRNKKLSNETDHSNDENVEDNPEYQELIKEMSKYNETNKKDLYNLKHLTKDKKEKSSKGGVNQKTTDISFFLLEDNLNEIIQKNTPSSNVNKKNFHKQEELKILNEVMELDNLTEPEKNYVLSEMLNLRNIIIKSKLIDAEIRNQINSKRIALHKLINKYFINSMLDDIKNNTVEKDKYAKKLKKLEKIQNFGIFTNKNLSILENKYILQFLDEEERKRRVLEEKGNKKLREKIALEEFENYKKKLEKKRKDQLIYDNSYLFKKEKPKEFKLRKEVEDIINKEYEEFQNHQNVRRSTRLMSLISKRKKPEKKKKFSKNKGNNLKLKKLQMQEEANEDANDSKQMKELEDQKLEELKDKRLKEFFERIRKLKNGEFKDFDEELNQLTNEIMDKKDVISKNKENRMNSFMQNFQYNRMKTKSNSKFNIKGFNFVSPIRFISYIQK